jgi:hypothetical protein
MRDQLSLSHEFLCITDDTTGLDDEITTESFQFDLMEDRYWVEKRTMWPKISIFDPVISGKFDIVLFLDLDVVICGSIDPFIEKVNTHGGLFMMRKHPPFLWRLSPEWARPYQQGNSSVVCFKPEEQSHIFSKFDRVQDPENFLNDQDYVTAKAKRRRYFPTDWCPPFRYACTNYSAYKRRITQVYDPPQQSSIIVFHGRPNPTDLSHPSTTGWGARKRRGFGMVEWVQSYWIRYAPECTQHHGQDF